MPKTPVLLYDIDGTLLRVQRPFLRQLIEEQLKRFKLIPPNSQMRSFAGRTDRGIFMELIGDHPEPDNLYLQIRKSYSLSMTEQLSREHIDLCAGAVESVLQSVKSGYDVGLCTGNFRSVAMKKVETAGLSGVFKFGGFGEASEDRNHLPDQAAREYHAFSNTSPEPERFIIIGDTPNDIRCAKFFGAKSVAVTTGNFSREELAKHQPDLIVDSLIEPGKWLKKLGF